MISHSKKSSTGGSGVAVDYLTAESEYLLAEQGTNGGTVWFGGKGAKTMGLRDGMDIDDIRRAMDRMLNGRHATTAAPLVQNAGETATLKVRIGPDGKPLIKDNGQALTTAEGAHTMGHDFTFSPPKAFSLLFAMSPAAEQKRLRTALAEAHGVAMDALAEYAQVRTGSASQGTIQYEKADIVHSAHVHFASRELDPQLHIHTMLYNLGRAQDGKWRALETQALLAARKDVDRLFTAHLAHLVQSMGYAVESVDLLDRKGEKTGATTWTLAGLPKEMERAFSKRREQIEAYLAEHPSATAQEACLETRKGKDEPPLVALCEMWAKEIATHAQALGCRATAEEYRTHTPGPHLIDWRTWNINGFVDACHDQVKRSTMSMSAIEAQVAMHAVAIDAEQCQKIAREIAAEHFVDIGARASKGAALSETQTLYVSHRWLTMEREIIGIARAGREDRYHAVDALEIGKQVDAFEASKGFRMADEQKAAIRHVAQDTGSIAVVEGLAGTGKTLSIVVAVNAWQARGRRVIGVSTSEAATRKLAEESGIAEAWNGAKLLDLIGRGQLTLTRDDVLILDEAGMMDTLQAHRILTAAQQAGAKCVLMGDVRQLQSVVGGSPMAACRDAIGSAVLQCVRRQEGKQLDITKLLYGTDKDGRLRTDQETRTPEEIRSQSAKVYAEMERQGIVAVHAEHAQAVADIARGFTSSAVPLDQRIVLAHTHADREALNASIRPILRDQGVLTGDEHAIKQPGAQTLAVAVGERITFDKNHQFRTERTEKGARVSADARTWAAHDKDGKALDAVRVVNGGTATVEAIRAEKDTHRITVRLHSDDKAIDGTRLSWLVQPEGDKKTPGFGHAYATTVHRSQGQTMRDVYHLANASASNSAVLVGFTRIKTNAQGTYHLAGDADSIDALKNYAIGRLDVQRNALDIIAETTRERSATPLVERLALTTSRGASTGIGIDM
jgi:conjugative relaxase-like TrwC/TraI family protein